MAELLARGSQPKGSEIAVLVDGIRNERQGTVPSCWPDIVIAGMEVIAAAPTRMNRAGYGEMTSMFMLPPIGGLPRCWRWTRRS